MCSAEGNYIEARKDDGSTIKIYWWDLGDSVPWCDAARYTDPFPFTTVFRAEDWEEWSQIESGQPDRSITDHLRAREAKDCEYLRLHGVRPETCDIIYGAEPIQFEDRATL